MVSCQDILGEYQWALGKKYMREPGPSCLGGNNG